MEQSGKVDTLRELALLSCQYIWARNFYTALRDRNASPEALEEAQKASQKAYQNLRRFVDRRVDTDHPRGLTLDDVGSFDIESFDWSGHQDFSCTINGREYVGTADWSCSQGEVDCSGFDVFDVERKAPVDDTLLLNLIEKEVERYLYEESGAILDDYEQSRADALYDQMKEEGYSE